MKENEETIAIYSRKSRFTGKGESIGNQVDLCRNYIRTAFGDDAAASTIVFEDEGFSGGNLNRPDFKRMMKAAREHKFRAIVVYRLDRISRNISDFSSLIGELGKLGIDFISIRESFDTSSPMGRAMMYIASVFSQLERETIAERIRDNMHELAKTGRWLGGVTPTGYISETVMSVNQNGRQKRVCRLKLIDEEAALVRKIYDLYSETDSLTLTETELLRQGCKTKTGKDFTRFSIKNILQNPVYLIADKEAYQYFLQRQAALFSKPEEFDGRYGVLAYNRTQQTKGCPTVYLPVSEWIVSVGQHPGLIPARIWIQVQESLERNRSRSYRKPRSNEALLTGLLWCACGSRMYPKLSAPNAKGEKRSYTYICRMKERSRRNLCSRDNADGEQLDAAVVQQIKCLAEDGTVTERLKKYMLLCSNQKERENNTLAQLRKQEKEQQQKMRTLIDTLADFSQSPAEGQLKQRIEELHQQVEEIKSRIRDEKAMSGKQLLSDEELSGLFRRLSAFSDGIDNMALSQKRKLVRALVRRVVWDGESAHILLYGTQGEEDDEKGLISGLGEDSK